MHVAYLANCMRETAMRGAVIYQYGRQRQHRLTFRDAGNFGSQQTYIQFKKELVMSSPGDQTNALAATPETTPAVRRSRLGTAIWIVVALIVEFFAVVVYMSPHAHLMPLKFFLLWFSGTFLGYVGVRLGDAVRRIAKPDILVVSGGISDALWVRICWSIGPQIVGLYVGAVGGTSILVGWFV
ncbi:hypothetical protein [Burkholderia gladioli]|uniref:hypothetical protein n=1 Tax=Burkholderia gladioli TaxID=28095 RepID=UPI001641A1DE|nr:hypothetical protein [Burkholderia gladioli]